MEEYISYLRKKKSIHSQLNALEIRCILHLLMANTVKWFADLLTFCGIFVW